MKGLWQKTSSSIGLLFVALGVLLADANDRGGSLYARPTSNAGD